MRVSSKTDYRIVIAKYPYTFSTLNKKVHLNNIYNLGANYYYL